VGQREVGGAVPQCYMSLCYFSSLVKQRNHNPELRAFFFPFVLNSQSLHALRLPFLRFTVGTTGDNPE
jgi:hypothetical protein